MRGLLLLLPVLLSACATTVPQPSAKALPSGMVQAQDARSANGSSRLPELTMEVLPSITRTGTVNAEALLLQRPIKASVIVTTLKAGTQVQVLGNLDNVDGQWLSVGIGDQQGWLRTTQVNP